MEKEDQGKITLQRLIIRSEYRDGRVVALLIFSNATWRIRVFPSMEDAGEFAITHEAELTDESNSS